MKRGREKYTRVMKGEDRDDFDARLLKRGGEEEEDKYVLVMRKAKDTNSRATVGDLDEKIHTRVIRGNQNWVTKDLLTRMG